MNQDFTNLKWQVLSELHYFFRRRKEATFKLDRYRKRYWDSWNRVPGFRGRRIAAEWNANHTHYDI